MSAKSGYRPIVRCPNIGQIPDIGSVNNPDDDINHDRLPRALVRCTAARVRNATLATWSRFRWLRVRVGRLRLTVTWTRSESVGGHGPSHGPVATAVLTSFNSSPSHSLPCPRCHGRVDCSIWNLALLWYHSFYDIMVYTVISKSISCLWYHKFNVNSNIIIQTYNIMGMLWTMIL
jgi:hypothetical protein